MQQDTNRTGQLDATGTPKLTARLVDPEMKAQKGEATVQVTVTGIELVDPTLATGRPTDHQTTTGQPPPTGQQPTTDRQMTTDGQMNQGHLHYRVDDGPTIATTATKLGFHKLSPGQHRIVVMLVGNDEMPLGPQETLTIQTSMQQDTDRTGVYGRQQDRDRMNQSGTDRDRYPTTQPGMDRDRDRTMQSGAQRGMDRTRPAGAQPDRDRTRDLGTQQDRDRTGMSGPMGTETPRLTATLLDSGMSAQRKQATVQVTVTGLEIVDPASVNEQPRTGQGHIHYQMDNGPVIATTNTKLSFHDLTPGQHTIVIMLAANDHTPLGPQETLTVTVP
jgi:hypothetical protein